MYVCLYVAYANEQKPQLNQRAQRARAQKVLEHRSESSYCNIYFISYNKHYYFISRTESLLFQNITIGDE